MQPVYAYFESKIFPKNTNRCSPVLKNKINFPCGAKKNYYQTKLL